MDNVIKRNNKIELFNRLKLLDSVGVKDERQIGPLRMGYKKSINVSINPMREESQPYDRYPESQSLQTQSFDGYKARKQRYSKNGSLEQTPLAMNYQNGSFNTKFRTRRATKDYATESTGVTSAEKMTLESKRRMQSLIELKASKNFTPKNKIPNDDIDYFQNDSPGLVLNVLENDQISSKYSIKTGKIKSKATISKELLAREIDTLNEGIDPAFHYFSQDFDELAGHKDLTKNATEWNQNISPSYLLGLKIKQRQKEYWKKRIRRDFSPALYHKEKKSRYDDFSLIQELEKVEERDSSRGRVRLKKL